MRFLKTLSLEKTFSEMLLPTQKSKGEKNVCVSGGGRKHRGPETKQRECISFGNYPCIAGLLKCSSISTVLKYTDLETADS